MHQHNHTGTPSLPGTVDIIWVRHMLAGIRSRGEPCDALLREAGIRPEWLQRAGATVTAEQYATLFRILMERRQDEMLGFLSVPFRYGSLALVTNHALGANTLGQAMRRSGQALGLLQRDFTLTLQRVDTRVAVMLTFLDATVAQHAFVHDMLLRVFWQFFAWLIGGRLPVERVDLAHPVAAPPQSYARIFPAPVHFECDRSALWLHADWLRTPVRRDKTALRHWLAHAQANVILPRHFDHRTTARVRQHLLFGRPRWSGLAATASALHVSTATLQRHLNAEGTSFQALKDKLRRDTAIVRLQADTISFYTLAQELGFGDATAFHRAFKRWTGRTPGSYRVGA